MTTEISRKRDRVVRPVSELAGFVNEESSAELPVLQRERAGVVVRVPHRRGTTHHEVAEPVNRALAIEPGFSAALEAARRRTKVTGYSRGDPLNLGAYNSPEESYRKTFEQVLAGRTLSELIQGRNGALVIDLMAPSGTLADIYRKLPSDPARRGIAVGLVDTRSDKEKERDEQLGIIQMKGDLTRTRAWRDLQEAMGGQKADLIMERAHAGVLGLPRHPQFYRLALQRLWSDCLSENEGILLLQIPTQNTLEGNLTAWGDKLNEVGIEANIFIPNSLVVSPRLLMVRRPDSPLELPKI